MDTILNRNLTGLDTLVKDALVGNRGVAELDHPCHPLVKIAQVQPGGWSDKESKQLQRDTSGAVVLRQAG